MRRVYKVEQYGEKVRNRPVKNVSKTVHKHFTFIRLTFFDILLTIITVVFLRTAVKKIPAHERHMQGSCGAEDGTRTHDLLITNQLLYQLSHSSIIYL